MPHPKTGFRHRAVYKIKQPHAFHFASQKFSFWVATFTLLAFVMGNMIGQHGWYAFWKSVLGKSDDALIVYTGTITPIDKVPDYARWSALGGDPSEHTYRMVPSDLLVPLPMYDSSIQRKPSEDRPMGEVYSVGNLGSYDDGAENDGSHVGVDIRVPIDTPIRSIANGIVETVRELNGGYGKYVVIRHPNVPDQNNTGKKTTIWSIYGHLNAILVTEGDIVSKGQQIGRSGMTGFASGPHLHFQIDNDQAPWHPYWPFTSAEADHAHMSFTQAINAKLHQDRGRMYTLNPMLFVQQNLNTSTVIASNTLQTTDTLTSSSSVPMTPKERMLARQAERQKRIDEEKRLLALQSSSVPSFTPTSSSSQASSVLTLASTTDDLIPLTPAPQIIKAVDSDVDHIDISHDGRFKRGWERVTIETKDANGNVVKMPSFPGKIYLRSGFGDAEYRPSELTSADFVDGRAVVNVLPLSAKRSLIIETKGAFLKASTPMELEN